MLNRRTLIEALLAQRPDNLLAVASVGSPAWDVAAAGDHAADFCFIGAMGQAMPFGLGLALAQPAKRIVVFAGDGEVLMSLGCLATLANCRAANLAIVVLDNGVYGETGGQKTATAGAADLTAIARGCGIDNAFSIAEPDAVEMLRDRIVSAPGPVFADAKIFADRQPLVLPATLDGVTAINRFRAAALAASPTGIAEK